MSKVKLHFAENSYFEEETGIKAMHIKQKENKAEGTMF